VNIVLIGFMGTGKTAVGKLLAKRLRRRFVDVDQLIERRAGRSVRQIFTAWGEARFRRLECATIARVAKHAKLVIATGGGAVLDPGNVAVLRNSGLVICLSASVRAILARIGGSRTRPLLANADRRRRIIALLRQRRPAYAQADVTIDTTHRTTSDAVRLIEAYVAKTPWPRTAFGRTMQVWDLPACFCKHTRLLSRRYPGRYVAIVDDHVVAVGRSRSLVYRQATQQLPAEKTIGVVYLPHREELVNVSPLASLIS